jgi:hypothetical protein
MNERHSFSRWCAVIGLKTEENLTVQGILWKYEYFRMLWMVKFGIK